MERGLTLCRFSSSTCAVFPRRVGVPGRSSDPDRRRGSRWSGHFGAWANEILLFRQRRRQASSSPNPCTNPMTRLLYGWHHRCGGLRLEGWMRSHDLFRLNSEYQAFHSLPPIPWWLPCSTASARNSEASLPTPRCAPAMPGSRLRGGIKHPSIPGAGEKCPGLFPTGPISCAIRLR